MSSTNKTTHYNLSQYTANDKPTYLVDYNADMSAIDTAIYTADTLANTNESAIGTLANLTTTVKTDLVSAVNEVDGEVGSLDTTVSGHTTSIASNTSAIGTLANLTTTVKTDLVSAVNEVKGEANTNASDIEALIDKLNLIRFDSYGQASMQFANFQYVSGSITVASNTDYSVLKIYGAVRGTSETNKATATITIPNVIPSGSRPSEDVTINPIGVITHDHNPLCNYTATIKANGNLVLTMTVGTTAGGFMATAIPFIIFVKNYGDLPE